MNNDQNFPLIILGLGNPGEKYVASRHNIGAQAVNVLVRKYDIRLKDTWGDARVGQGSIAGRPVILAHSRTFMNQSGAAAKSLLGRAKVPPEQLLVLCDQLDLPLGKLRLRPGGSTAGQNGLRSIEEHIGTQEFPRIRMGIGRPERPFDWPNGREQYEEQVIRWVLTPFSKEEEPEAQAMRERICDAIECLLIEGIDAAMNRFN